MNRRVEIQLRNPLMIEWATQCINSQQILWRGGYPQAVTSVYHDGSTGVATTTEMLSRSKMAQMLDAQLLDQARLDR